MGQYLEADLASPIGCALLTPGPAFNLQPSRFLPSQTGQCFTAEGAWTTLSLPHDKGRAPSAIARAAPYLNRAEN